jgi:hypothetical protein
MTATDHFDLGKQYFSRTLAYGSNFLMGGRYVNPHTEKDSFVLGWTKSLLEEIARSGRGKDFSVDPSGWNDHATVTLWPMNEPHKWNSLRLHVKQVQFGYDAQLKLYVKEHPMPVAPRPVTYMKHTYEMPEARVRDIRHYLGLPAPLDETQPIEVVNDPAPKTSRKKLDLNATQAFNTGTE